MDLRFTIVREGGSVPARAHEGDAGLDLRSAVEARVGPSERLAIPTGVAVEIPPGHAGLVLPRSGLARRHGLTLVNAPGLIDSGYRGEVEVLILNTDPAEAVKIESGDRIAQLLIVSHPVVDPVRVDDLSSSERGTRGFGSSGVA